jgi:uncharacterized protein YeaO (DUF488 family)
MAARRTTPSCFSKTSPALEIERSGAETIEPPLGDRMAVRIVRLGSPRARGEGVRLGTVRRPPRGVARSRFARDDWYDVWFPTLAPSAGTLKLGRAAGDAAAWRRFAKKYRAEMRRPDADRALDLLARLSHDASFSVGCYCEDESRCHRSILRELLAARGAVIRR